MLEVYYVAALYRRKLPVCANCCVRVCNCTFSVEIHCLRITMTQEFPDFCILLTALMGHLIFLRSPRNTVFIVRKLFCKRRRTEKNWEHYFIVITQCYALLTVTKISSNLCEIKKSGVGSRLYNTMLPGWFVTNIFYEKHLLNQFLLLQRSSSIQLRVLSE